jgi:hypothetical protein
MPAPKAKTVLKTPKAKPAKKSTTSKARATKVVSVHDAGGGANKYFQLQKPIIHLVEEYQLNHGSDGKKMLLRTFCENSGISVANMTAIMNGTRWVAQCSRDTIEKLANILNVPVMQIYTMSAFLTAKDVIMPTSQEETVGAIYTMMAKDKRLEYRVPTEDVWNTWPESAKLCFCMMYEKVIGKALFRYAAIK